MGSPVYGNLRVHRWKSDCGALWRKQLYRGIKRAKKLTDGSRVSHNRVLGSEELTVKKSKVVSNAEKVSASMKLCSHGR